MVLVLTILTLIGGISGFVILQSMKAYARTVPAMDNAYQARSSIDRMVREIRSMKDRNGITTMTSGSLTFSDSSGTSVAYTVSSGNLTRNGDLMAKGVTSLAFTYWKSDGTTASTYSTVYLIEIDLTVQNQSQTYRLQTAVFPRVCSHG